MLILQCVTVKFVLIYIYIAFRICNVKLYRRSSGLRKNESLHVTKDCTSLSVFMLFFFGIMRLLVEETITDISANIWTCLKDMPLYLTFQYRKCTCFYLLLCRWGMMRGHSERLQVHALMFLWPFVEKLWQEINSFIYWHFYISVTTQVNLI
jgi:hypothetical protein